MQNRKLSTEDIAKQLTGISHILESIAEDTVAETKAEIKQACHLLMKIANLSGEIYPDIITNCTKIPQNTTPALFDSTNITTRKIDIDGFENVEVDCAFIFEITEGKSFSIAITANKSLFDNINVAKSGDTLRISLKPVRFNARPVLEARIIMPVLKRLRQSAATRGAVAGFRSSNPFDLYQSGASSVNLDIESGDVRLEVSGASCLSGKLKAPKVDILLSGASRAHLSGLCDNLSLSAWGAVELDMAEFHSQEGTVYLKGASQATVRVIKRLDVDLTGASCLQYIGNPSLNEITLSGASTLNQFSNSS